MNICICDDDTRFCKDLELALTRYSFHINCSFHVTIYSSPDDLLNCNRIFDLLFIDIRFSGEDVGIRLAEELRRRNIRSYIIFFTSLPGFAQDGYKSAAFRYLMKPICEAELEEAMNAMIRRMNSPEMDYYLTVKTGIELKVINLQTLKWIESNPGDRHRRLFFASGGTEVRESLKSLASRLPEGMFAHTHQSYLVNLSFVQSVRADQVRLTSGETIPIGRAYKKTFLAALEQYARGLAWQ
jgi:DNA-binding LytR/AlgR family response regulator